MKVFILTLLVFNTMCFALGDEEKNFIRLDEGNEQPAMKADVEANDFVEDANQNDMTELEDEEEAQEDEESDDEPEDPEGFKDDDVDLDASMNQTSTQEKPVLEPTILPPTDESAGSGNAADEAVNDEDLKSTLEDKLGLK
ncbi:nuclear polyadenylated RNA-binding protein 3-like [Acropora millepora]|uniref:nuclear polyadenylated RNA-binding protein 3-like n=1 Tax=Acropora millepora TaxID=45264 RepID=UPI001CF2C81F|nr:nuclear polyadenylated RNA-binding protein 3-like [Acropora millepora]XP_044180802.1 nuclear polyadenylated RNA-binding protein 3-like [Acropora millepora]